MTLTQAMNAYGKTDKQYFPCLNGFDDNKRPSSTFYADFCVAEAYSTPYNTDPISDTFKRAFEGWKNDVRMFTELSMVLNHLLWQHYENNDYTLSRLYDALWRKADEYAATLKGDDGVYYYTVTD